MYNIWWAELNLVEVGVGELEDACDNSSGKSQYEVTQHNKTIW